MGWPRESKALWQTITRIKVSFTEKSKSCIVKQVLYERYTNADLPKSSSSYEDNMLKISYLNTFYFLRYAHVRYVKSLFANIQKQ